MLTLLKAGIVTVLFQTQFFEAGIKISSWPAEIASFNKCERSLEFADDGTAMEKLPPLFSSCADEAPLHKLQNNKIRKFLIKHFYLMGEFG